MCRREPGRCKGLEEPESRTPKARLRGRRSMGQPAETPQGHHALMSVLLSSPGPALTQTRVRKMPGGAGDWAKDTQQGWNGEGQAVSLELSRIDPRALGED